MDQNQNLVFAELEERAEQIFATIDELRARSGDGKQRRELLDSIFRDVHSVKGAASASGLHQLGAIAHEFEGLLHSLRIGQARLDQQVLQTIEEAAQALLDELDPHDSGNQRNHTALFNRLRQLSDSSSNRRLADGESVLNALDHEIWQTLSQEEKHRLKESVGEGANVYLVTTNFDITDFDQQFQDLKDRLTETGEVISIAPKVENEHPDKINFRILYTRDAPLQQVRTELAQLADVSVNEVFSPQPLSAIPGADETGIPINVGAIGGESPGTAAADSSTLIRIHLDDLDRVIASAHKLFRETTAGFDRAIENLSEPGVRLELESKAAGVSNSFMELAAQIINLRMISIDRILQRALRSGRAAALAAGKDVDFVITGRDLLLDKSLCDAIGDPLIHLVRNAVDHGIENPTQRSQNGKSERGSIRIEASTTQGQTSVTVTDDGRGIDPAQVSKVAISLGIAEEGTILDMDHSLRLIFRPGFSTAALASGISGRGVGLDVVETAVEQVGGEVRVASKPGVGSSFEMRLPTTFGLLEVVDVSSAEHRYIFDNGHILSCKSTGVQEIETVESGKVLNFQSELWPLVHLRELLGQPSGGYADNQQLGVVLCQISKEDSDGTESFERIGIVVDAVGEKRQVLVRNLGTHGSRWYGVAGATELRDGTVALLLDLPRLLRERKS